MTKPHPFRYRVGAAVLMLAVLPGCAGALVAGGVATGAAVAHDRRTAGNFVDDQLIELKAKAALTDDERFKDRAHVNITSFNGTVLLTGEIASAALRQAAEGLVGEVDGVRRVVNETRIASPSAFSARASDSWITGKVKAGLLKDLGLDGTRVKVVTRGGTVYLMGIITRDEAAAATESAKQVGGVQRIVRVFEYSD